MVFTLPMIFIASGCAFPVGSLTIGKELDLGLRDYVHLAPFWYTRTLSSPVLHVEWDAKSTCWHGPCLENIFGLLLVSSLS